jgi:hypothetical protein
MAEPGTSDHVPVHEGCGEVFADSLDCPDEQDKMHGKVRTSHARARGSMRQGCANVGQDVKRWIFTMPAAGGIAALVYYGTKLVLNLL